MFLGGGDEFITTGILGGESFFFEIQSINKRIITVFVSTHAVSVTKKKRTKLFLSTNV